MKKLPSSSSSSPSTMKYHQIVEMTGIDDSCLKELIQAARSVSERAHCIYSQFRVGAALAVGNDTIVMGCNVENASYGLTICAERSAIVSAISQGHSPRDFKAMIIYAPDGQQNLAVTPCGACRQVLAEFAPEMWVIAIGGQGQNVSKDIIENYQIWKVMDLLPNYFGPSNLFPASSTKDRAPFCNDDNSHKEILT